MQMVYIVAIVLMGFVLGWVLMPRAPTKRKLKPGDKLTNRKGKHYEVNSGGGITYTGTVGEFLDHPNVRKQLDGFQRLYMTQTIMALWQGERPPHSVDGYGTLTKKKLIVEWNDDWQAAMDKLSEYHDISYDILFDIQPEPIWSDSITDTVEGQWTYHRDDEGVDHRMIEADDSITHENWIHIYGGNEKETS